LDFPENPVFGEVKNEMLSKLAFDRLMTQYILFDKNQD